MADHTTPDRDLPPTGDASPADGGGERSADTPPPRRKATGSAKKTGGAAKKAADGVKKTTGAAKRTGGMARKATGSAAKKTTAGKPTPVTAETTAAETTSTTEQVTETVPTETPTSDTGTTTAATPPAPRTTTQPEHTGQPGGMLPRTVVPTGAWADAAWEAVRRPGEPPERLAELAVAELGPRAAAWVDTLRRTYPDATPDQLARLAAWQATRRAWLLGAIEAAGPGAALRLPATALVRAALVLRVAAAYGYDPTDARRASDLLHLLGLSEGAVWWPVGRSGVLVAVAARLVGRKVLARAVRTLAAVGEERDSLERLAHRAVRYYRRGMPS